ncbi:hypothetical protein B0J13DRAFT_664882 [Dactylonectria estremocensis]|uniref:Arrestin C-terminal-like domain-containing protein n=1 Tax=Dactylonectria estremocensis TaxID=1079267 RepID=A0A9P9EYN4_9HYPO|nr:hypothetical protein B0J13DRAFT_664882 [Dactylonectria estremocensis]
MRSFLARVTGTPRARLKILQALKLPDCDYVFLSGHGEEARGQYLRGKAFLTLAKGEHVKGVHLKMTGRLSLQHHGADKFDSNKWEINDFFLHEWDPFLVQGPFEQQSTGWRTYEWPFELFIQGNQQESFRGCSHCGITYTLEASTFCEGPSNGILSFAPIRILRSPPLSDFDLMDPVTAQGKWAGKVEYNVTVRHRAIALGGLVPIDAQLRKLEPGVQITMAKFYLRETHALNDRFLPDLVTYEGQRIVTEWPLSLDATGIRIPAWQEYLELPKVVRRCSPDFNICGITIKHTLHFEATLGDSDGAELEYQVSIPVVLFVSPELPVNGWGVFAQEPIIGTDDAVHKDALSEGIHVPPKYIEEVGGINDCASPPPPYDPF